MEEPSFVEDMAKKYMQTNATKMIVHTIAVLTKLYTYTCIANVVLFEILQSHVCGMSLAVRIELFIMYTNN